MVSQPTRFACIYLRLRRQVFWRLCFWRGDRVSPELASTVSSPSITTDVTLATASRPATCNVQERHGFGKVWVATSDTWNHVGKMLTLLPDLRRCLTSAELCAPCRVSITQTRFAHDESSALFFNCTKTHARITSAALVKASSLLVLSKADLTNMMGHPTHDSFCISGKSNALP